MSPGKAAPAADGPRLAREILRLSEVGDHQAVLRLLGDDPSAGSTAARKAFLRISLLVHPDKLPGCIEAKQAFQVLVSALEHFLQGPAPVEKKLKQPALSRPNDGCFRTEVQCPRCQTLWGGPSQGNPDYYYNFLMEGLRTFTCATCLLEFGCMAAVHLCPACHKPFEYQPDMYHKRVKCGNPGCTQSFGFVMFHASENALKHARAQILADLERRTRCQEARSSRAARAARRNGAVDASAMAEAAFLCGLRDTCPRCGLELEHVSEGDQLRHLRECNDTEAQRQHRERESRTAATAQAKEAKRREQLSVAKGAAWSFVGGKTEELWKLDEAQLRGRCAALGLATKGDEVALIERLVKAGDAPSGSAAGLPANLLGRPDAQLAAICAAHGLNVKRLGTREQRIEVLEELRANIEEGVGTASPPAAVGDRAKAHAKAKVKMLMLKDQSSVDAKTKAKAKAKAKGKAKAPLLALEDKPKAKLEPKAKGKVKAKNGATEKAKGKARTAEPATATAPKAKALVRKGNFKPVRSKVTKKH